MKKRSKIRSRIKSKIKSKRRYKSRPKRRYKQKQYDYGLSNSKSEHYTDDEISIMNRLVTILRNYEKVELITNEDRKNILNETVISMQLLKIKNPTEKIWTDKGNIGLLNWYITQLSDDKKDIRMLISKILKKANP